MNTLAVDLSTSDINFGLDIDGVFSEYRMFPDLPGNARAWGTIFRYLDGCLIFRPVNQSRYLKYDDYIKPWLHFIPVNEDFSDLAQKAEFAIQNTMQSAYIAWNGYLAARRYLINIEAAFPEDSFYNIGCHHKFLDYADIYYNRNLYEYSSDKLNVLKNLIVIF